MPTVTPECWLLFHPKLNHSDSLLADSVVLESVHSVWARIREPTEWPWVLRRQPCWQAWRVRKSDGQYL